MRGCRNNIRKNKLMVAQRCICRFWGLDKLSYFIPSSDFGGKPRGHPTYRGEENISDSSAVRMHKRSTAYLRPLDT